MGGQKQTRYYFKEKKVQKTLTSMSQRVFYSLFAFKDQKTVAFNFSAFQNGEQTPLDVYKTRERSYDRKNTVFWGLRLRGALVAAHDAFV